MRLQPCQRTVGHRSWRQKSADAWRRDPGPTASPDKAERGTGRASGAVWITTVCPDACRLGCQWLRVVRSAITVAAVFLNGSCHMSKQCEVSHIPAR